MKAPLFSYVALIFFGFTFVFSIQNTFAEEAKKGGWLRERIKERIVERQKSKPAPEASSDLSKKITEPGDYTFSLKWGGHVRYYKVHVPKVYSTKPPLPVVFAFHGGGGDMEVQSNDKFYGQISKSEKAGYIAVFPNGFSKFESGKLATWNAGKCCAFARDMQIDDVGFIKEIIKNLQQQLNIDSQRIFAAGMSNGAMMSYRLACEMPETFKAIAAVAGTDNTSSCTPKTAVSILHIHAKDDDHVLFKGGAGASAFPDRSQVTEFTSVQDSIAKWVQLNHCEGTAKKTLEVSGAYCEKYSNCSNKSEVQLCVTETGGHSWPGGYKPGRRSSGPSKALSAIDVMWDFFQNR